MRSLWGVCVEGDFYYCTTCGKTGVTQDSQTSYLISVISTQCVILVHLYLSKFSQ